MNRVIKFRAWDDQAKKMSEPFYPLIGEEHIVYDWPVYKPDTIYMQFTGLLDETDKEIYDGDIISDSIGDIFIIEWNDDTCKFQFNDGSDINDGSNYGTYKLVIGNIYENPELIK